MFKLLLHFLTKVKVGWQRRDRGRVVGDIDALELQKPDFDLHREQHREIFRGLGALHVLPQERVDPVAPVVEGGGVGSHEVQ